MDMCKLRGPFLQIHYSFLCLVAVIKDVLETYQEVVFISQLSLFAPAVIESFDAQGAASPLPCPQRGALGLALANVSTQPSSGP